MKTDNKTLYDIKNNTEQSLLAAWSLTVLLLSIFGDTIIMIATTKYHAIKLNKVMIAVIQHMAVWDLIQSVFELLPITLAFMADGWVMGQLLCHVQSNAGGLCALVTISLTCGMTTLN